MLGTLLDWHLLSDCYARNVAHFTIWLDTKAMCNSTASPMVRDLSQHPSPATINQTIQMTRMQRLRRRWCCSVVLASLSHNNALRRFPAPKEFLFWWLYFGDDCSESQMVWLIIKQPVHWRVLGRAGGTICSTWAASAPLNSCTEKWVVCRLYKDNICQSSRVKLQSVKTLFNVV